MYLARGDQNGTNNDGGYGDKQLLMAGAAAISIWIGSSGADVAWFKDIFRDCERRIDQITSPQTQDRERWRLSTKRFASYSFVGANHTHRENETHMTISIRVKCTAAVPREAIPRGISYPGTKGGSDDKIAFSSVGGALAILQRLDQRSIEPALSGLTFCSSTRS